jgi:DNA-binding winged helix-turn-helix (wHTH) protein/Flp pilus assembly protein TadD
MTKGNDELYEFAGFRLDVGDRRIERRDGKMNGSLPEKAFQTLVYLLRNPGALVEKEELLAAVWPNTVVEENNLGKAIHAIRNFLGEKSAEQKYIETVPKHGYRFVATVVRLSRDDGSDAQSVNEHARKLVGSPAYDLYLHGKVKASSENREDMEAAIQVLHEALARDPEFAPAYAQLARAYSTLAFKFSSESKAKEFHEDAEVAVLKALAIDPKLAEAHFARGLIVWTKRKGFPHEQAIRSYKRSLELDPTDDETHHQLSMVYSHVGLLDEANSHVEKALDLNPNNTMARFRAGSYKAYQGLFDEAISMMKKIPREVSPLLVDRSTADALVQIGGLSEAEAIADQYLNEFPQDEGGSFTSVKAVVLAKNRNTRDAETAIERAVAIGSSFGHFHHTAYNIAAAYAAMDKPDSAVKWLEKTADDGFPNLPYFEIDPNLDSLRDHPGFLRFMPKLRPQWDRLRELAHS